MDQYTDNYQAVFNSEKFQAFVQHCQSTATTTTNNIPNTNTSQLQNFNRSVSDPRYKPSSDNLYKKTDDELWLETYLSKIGKINLSLQTNAEVVTKKSSGNALHHKSLKIHVAKSLLHRCLKLLEELEKSKNYLRENVATISSAEWKERTEQIGYQKDEFTALLSQFDNKLVLEKLTKSLKLRKRKRISKKRKKTAEREENARILRQRQLAHRHIDQLLEKNKHRIERAKKEENMKKDADCILAEVTKKKSDARKQLSILSALRKLRDIREKAAIQRGEKISIEDSSAFNHNTERLKKMWEDALIVYAKEEQFLQATLDKMVAEEKNAALLEKQKIVDEWENILFGPKIIPNDAYLGLTCAEKNLVTFIAIRKSWDTFLSTEGGSRMPIGWVIPKPAAPGWSYFLKKTEK